MIRIPPREQTFTVNGTVILAGTKDNEKNLSELDVVPCPGEEWKKNISVQVTVEGDPQYKVTIADCANGTVTTNAAQTDADGTPLFYAGDLVMLSVVPDEGYRLKSLLVEEADSGLAVDHDDADSFIQPAADVRIIAEFEEIRAVKPTAIRVTGEYVYNGGEQLANVEGYDAETMNIDGNIATDAGTYTVSVTSKTGRWTDGTTDAATAQWRIERAEQEAPDGLQGVGPTTEGGSDGKIIGTDTSMEYRAAAEASYTACTGSEIENLTAGSYFVRYAEDRNHFASPDTEVVVGEGEARSFTITFNANGGTGSMEPVTVEEGSRYVLPACGFTAPAGQEFKAWEIGGIEYNAGDDYVVLGNTEIKALWKASAVIPTTFTITFNANGGTGSMEPVTVEEGSRYPLPACGFIPPVNMQFSGWALSADGSVIADGAIMVTSNITLHAIWEPVPVNEFVVFFDGNGGTPAVSSMTTIGHRLAFLPGAFRSGSYRFDGWYTERNGGELITTSTVFAANTIVYAHWTYTGGSGGSGGYVPGYYIIRATAGAGGSITPSGDVSVRAGANQTFTITPNRGYAVSDVKIDGRSIGAVRSYTFENISASHTIEVQFRVRSSFVDVPSGSYYEDAVDWAVANGITTGTDAAHFSPDGICTRAQAVTFLWRAAGRPAPESRTMPFTDVPADSYYYDAVLWAVENGITKGTSSTTFSPDDTCTRAQIVTFLWRSEQSPAAGSSNPFTDVSADAYYADAVLWAVKEAITTGTTRTTFSPDAECTRAQIVTFLWRCKK
ncbi:MAG: S-layer homology domain-containing protein [Oscillospiraceae bacterium]